MTDVDPVWKPKPRRTTAKARRRKKDERTRLKIRGQVLAFAGFQCEYKDVIPEIACGWLPDRLLLEVDELRGGSYRASEWLDVDRCRATCPVHHDWKTNNKREFLRRYGS